MINWNLPWSLYDLGLFLQPRPSAEMVGYTCDVCLNILIDVFFFILTFSAISTTRTIVVVHLDRSGFLKHVQFWGLEMKRCMFSQQLPESILIIMLWSFTDWDDGLPFLSQIHQSNRWLVQYHLIRLIWGLFHGFYNWIVLSNNHKMQ